MNFRWDMTEEDWKRLKDVHKNKIVDDGCCGSCYVGGLCCNIQHAQDKDNWYVFANFFLVKEGATYGELRDGTGYLCYHDFSGVPIRCRSFTSFKSKFEKYFENFVIKCEELKVFVDMDVSWERGCGA